MVTGEKGRGPGDRAPECFDCLPLLACRGWLGGGGCCGFSLIEIAVIMLIISVLLGGGISSFSSMRDKQQQQKTEILLEEVRKALIDFAVTNGRLPCPDIGDGSEFDGREDRDGFDNCRQSYGVLPWQDLGLGNAGKFDFWGNYLSYHVDNKYSNFEVGQRVIDCNGDQIEVKLANIGNLTVLNKIPCVVVSHGKNGDWAILPTPTVASPYIVRKSGSETEKVNAFPDSSGQLGPVFRYVERGAMEIAPADDPKPVIDDLLTYVTPMQIRSRVEIECKP